ncbi:MAG TPA: hypothetical protein VF469_13785 [Kofleriaceae bacterium]
MANAARSHSRPSGIWPDFGHCPDTGRKTGHRHARSPLPYGNFLFCPNGSHLAMWDDQQVYLHGLVTFLQAVDRGEPRHLLSARRADRV